jgi:hypothetical protein
MEILKMAKQYDNSLVRVCSYSFPSSNLLTIQLLRSVPKSEKETNSAKIQYFFMLTLVPGEKVESGYNDSGRTYKFDRSVSVKYGIHEIMALSYVMKRFALGQGAIIGNYVKFSRSSTGQKRVSVWESTKNIKGPKGEYPQRIINLGVSGADNHVFNFNPEDANSFSEIIDQLSKKGIDLEFNRQYSTATNTNQIIFENKSQTFTNTTDESEVNEEVINKFGTMLSTLNDVPWVD